MTPTPFRFTALLFAAGCAAASILQAEPGHVFKPLTAEEISAIAAAVPAHPRVAPAHPRALLVFYRTEAYVHTSIPYANEALRLLGERTGAYRADFSDDMAVFTPQNLARYDAVLFQNTTHLDFKDPAQRAALLDFIKSGKGFVGIHAASDNFYSWPEAQAMLGGLFHDHPWISVDTVGVKVDDPTNPVAAAFGGRGFWIREELYQIVGPYSRSRQRVLLSLDMTRTENARDPKKFVRTDRDFPISWIKTYGQGRVFYTSIGHNTDLYRTPEILQHYLDGIQFALGDLKADATPPTATITPALAPFSSLPLQFRGYQHALPPDYLEKIAAYNFGADRAPLVILDLYLHSDGRHFHPEIEQSLLSLLARPALPDGAKDYIIRTLAAIGSDASVPALQKLLDDPRMGGLALSTLFAIPGPATDAVLIQALDSANPDIRLAAINAVGRRSIEAAIPRLNAFLAAPDRATVAAALTALGDMGTRASLQALRDAHPAAELAGTRQWAELAAAARLLPHLAPSLEDEAGRVEVKSAYNEILDAPTSAMTHVAALKGLASAEKGASQDEDQDVLPLVIGALHDPSARVRFAAANLFASMWDHAASVQISGRFSGLDPSVQVALLEAFNVRRSPGTLPLLLEALHSPDAAVRLAALRAMGGSTAGRSPVRLARDFDVVKPADFKSPGNPAAIAPLLAHLTGTGDESQAAADSLGRLRAPGVGAALIAALPAASPPKKAALLQVLAARADHRVYPFALAAITDPAASVRSAAFAAVAATARQDDLPTVLLALRQAVNAADRRAMERALLEVVRAAPDPNPVVDAIDGALPSTPGPARGSLLVAIALAGNDHAQAVLARVLLSPAAEDRRAAIHAIADARIIRLGGLLLSAAKSDPDPNERILALRDYLDLLQVPDGRSKAEVEAGYALAWPLAVHANEQDAIIAGLKDLDTDTAGVLLAKYRTERIKP